MLEIQSAQKIIDSHWRLNRVPAIEKNSLSSGTLDHLDPDAEVDGLAEEALAQAHGWAASENSFDKLGLVRARLST